MNRLFLAGLLGVTALLAQAPGPAPDDDGLSADDPPSRVARLSWITGDVAFQPATVDEWSDATLNYPLTTGDHLYVNPGGRAELQIDGTAIRLNSSSNFGFLNLDDNIVQISLSEGSIDIRLRQLDRDDSFEIDTPNGAVTLLRAGEYRIDSDPNRNITLVTVRTGQAEMYQEGNSLLVTAHQTVRFSDDGPEVNREYPADDFDLLVTARNDAEDALPRRDDVSDSMTGAEDLYAYGTWDEDPSYGRIWMPPVDAGWTPYSTGRWAFVEPWGWTWVDEAPWGFAPFHYGRWVMARGGWAWIPGERVYRPVYSPALVGFIGGSGFGVSIGWFPLGPHEPWVPSWRASRRYINRVNAMNVRNGNVNATNIRYVNRERAIAISREDFAGARPVRGSSIRFSNAQIRDAQVLDSGPRVMPARSGVAIGAARPAPRFRDRTVVVRTPPPPPPVLFQARQPLLQQNDGQPLRSRQLEQIRGQQPGAVVQRNNVRELGNSQRGRPRQQGRGSGASPAQAAPPFRNRPAQVDQQQQQQQQPEQQRPQQPPQQRQRPQPQTAAPVPVQAPPPRVREASPQQRPVQPRQQATPPPQTAAPLQAAPAPQPAQPQPARPAPDRQNQRR